MGKLLNYLGESKILKRIADVLNVTDVKVNGTSVVDNNGIADIDLSLYTRFEVVQTLPSVGESGVIYLVPKSTAQTDNVYDEYIWTNNDWELIGTTEIDLSNYYTKTEVDNLIPDELSDLQDDSTHRLVTDTEKSTWNGKANTDEKVKQEYVYTSNTTHYFIGSNSDSESDETNYVKKIKHAYINALNGHLILNRKHTSSTVSNQMLGIGNDIPDGTAGAVDGYLRLFGKGEYYFQFYDGNNGLTGNQTYRPRNRTGVLGLLNDVWDNSLSEINKDFNLIYPPYYHANGNYDALYYSSNEETGNYTVKGSRSSNLSLNIKRYTQGLYLSAGTYRLSGCPSGGSSSTYDLRVYTSTESGTTTLLGNDYGSGFEFSLKETSLIHIVFYIRANTNVDFTFRPTIKKISDWVDLGSQTIDTTITLTEQYSELMFVSEINNYGKSFNLPVLRVQLSTTHSHFTDGMGLNDLEVWLDGSSIKFIINSATPTDVVKLYAKA